MLSKILAISSLLTLSFSSIAATSGTLLLKGQVGQVLSIAVTPESIATTLPLDESQADTKVATVNEKSNLAGGYKVKVSSENVGNLERVGGTELFPYTMKYDGQQVNLASSQTFQFPTAGITDVNKDVTISYTGVDASNMVSGEYTDTVLFEISAN